MDGFLRCVLLIPLCGLPVIVGCKSPKPDFVSATIVVRPCYGSDLRAAQLEITDHAEVKRLVSFFPGLGTAKQWTLGGADWKDEVRIVFTTRSGDTVTVRLNFAMEVWSEGKGDWSLSPELKPYFLKLLENAPDAPSE